MESDKISIAAIRKMEIDYLSDPSHKNITDQPKVQQQAKPAQPAAQPAAVPQSGPALNVAAINATLQTLGNAP